MSLVILNRTPAVSDVQQYRLIRASIYPFFLAAVAASRIWQVGRRESIGSLWSIFAEAQAASANALSVAFQG